TAGVGERPRPAFSNRARSKGRAHLGDGECAARGASRTHPPVTVDRRRSTSCDRCHHVMDGVACPTATRAATGRAAGRRPWLGAIGLECRSLRDPLAGCNANRICIAGTRREIAPVYPAAGRGATGGIAWHRRSVWSILFTGRAVGWILCRGEAQENT